MSKLVSFFRNGMLPISEAFQTQRGMVLRNCRSATLQDRLLHVSSATRGSTGGGYHKPSELDKKILVWTKAYSKAEDIPVEISYHKMKKAKDWFRIRVSILMMISTVLLSIPFLISGKRAAERGESVSLSNRQRHAGYYQQNKE